VANVRKGVGSDSRIASVPFSAWATAVMLPKDVKALIKTAEESGMALQILHKVDEVNERQNHFVDKIMKHFGGDIRGRCSRSGV
jgi:UDPglucose 6-dehydrogenase